MAMSVTRRYRAEDHDSLLRLAKLLTAKKIRGSFCMVGEKARVLRERGRTDVLKALEPHEIGFHSRDHSVHPTIAPRCEELGWTAGLGAEFGFAPNWSAKVEYLYVDLANSNFVITGASHGLSFGTVRAGVNYRF